MVFSTNGTPKGGEEGSESRPVSPHTLNLSPGDSSMEMFKSSIREINGIGETSTMQSNHLNQLSEFTPEQSRYFKDLTCAIPLTMASALSMATPRNKNEEPQLLVSG